MRNMKLWRTSASEPEGAIPTRRAAALVLAGTAAAMAVWLALGPSEDAGEAAPAPPPQVNEDPESTVLQAGAAVEDAAEVQRAESEAAALLALEAERAAREDPFAQQRERDRQRVVEDIGWPAEGGAAYAGVPPYYGDPGAQSAPPGYAADAEFALEQRRALQASLRSPPVAQSLRGTLPPPAEGAGAQPEPPPPAPAGAGEDPPAEPEPPPPAAQPPAQPALPAAAPRPDYGHEFEVIDEGAIAEAVMRTEIRADFAGPVEAVVNIPMWSRDGQRVLIPRGTRALGSTGSVEGWGQSRLAVSFHRLILPDGHRVALDFRGLSQAGASSLRDRVNRHYWSTFGAAGAVGLLSGLSQIGAQRPSLATPGDARFVAGQRIGEAAGEIFQRYLNRPPSITIRAGHRVRIWFTSDAVVPRRFPPG